MSEDAERVCVTNLKMYTPTSIARGLMAISIQFFFDLPLYFIDMEEVVRSQGEVAALWFFSETGTEHEVKDKYSQN